MEHIYEWNHLERQKLMPQPGTAGIGAQAAAQTTESQIHAGMVSLEKTISFVEDSANVLRDRLNPVLLDPTTTDECSEKELQEPVVPLANDLRDLYAKAAGINEILIDILQRLGL